MKTGQAEGMDAEVVVVHTVPERLILIETLELIRMLYA